MVTTEESTSVSISVNGEERWSGNLDSMAQSDEAADALRDVLNPDDPADWPEPDKETWHLLDTDISIEHRNFLNELQASIAAGEQVAVTLSRLTVKTDLLLGRNKDFKDEEKALAYFAKLSAEIYRLNLEGELLQLL